MAEVRGALRATALAIALALIAAVGLYVKARGDLVRGAEREMSLLETLRSSALLRYLESARSEIVLWSTHGPPREAASSGVG